MTLHKLIFGSEEIEVRGIGNYVKHGMETRSQIWLIAIDPPPGEINGYDQVKASMCFVSFLVDTPKIDADGRTMGGMYVINTDAFKKWVSKVKTTFPNLPENARKAGEKLVIVRLAAHEIRHEIQFAQKPVFHKISELEKIDHQTFLEWNSGMSDVFRRGYDQPQIDREEDALTVEVLAQHMLMKDSLSDNGRVVLNLFKIAQIVKA